MFCFVWNGDDDNNDHIQDRQSSQRNFNKDDDDIVSLAIKANTKEGILKLECIQGEDKIQIFEDQQKKTTIQLPYQIDLAGSPFLLKPICIEGVKGSESIGDITLVLTREVGNTPSKVYLHLTVVPLIALNGMYNKENVSLYDVAWKPDGSYALAVGDRATVVKYTPNPDDHYDSLTMLTNWRDQLDTLEPVKDQNGKIIEQGIHKVPDAPGDERNSYLNRFDAIKWSPDSSSALIVGGAYQKFLPIPDSNRPELFLPPRVVGEKQFLYYIGGGSILSFHAYEPIPFKLPETSGKKYRPKLSLIDKEFLELLKNAPEKIKFYKFWNVAWQPYQNLAVIVGERFGRVFKCIQPPGNIPLVVEEIPIKLKGVEKLSADLQTLLWKRDGTCIFLMGDDPTAMPEVPEAEQNWKLWFEESTLEPKFDHFENKAGTTPSIAWHPTSNYAIAKGVNIKKAGLYKCDVITNGDLVIPENLVADLPPLKVEIRGRDVSFSKLTAIEWHPISPTGETYVIFTGGIPSDLLYSNGYFPNGYREVGLFDPQTNKIFYVRFPGQTCLGRVQWRPGSNSDKFFLTVVMYRR